MRMFSVIVLAALFLPLAARADGWSEPDLGESIRQGAADRQFIRLIVGTGALVRFDRSTGERAVLTTDARTLLVDEPHYIGPEINSLIFVMSSCR